VAVIERVQLESPLDENSTRHYDITSEYKEDYPYVKTRSGVL
jgi:hypothetical protein